MEGTKNFVLILLMLNLASICISDDFYLVDILRRIRQPSTVEDILMELGYISSLGSEIEEAFPNLGEIKKLPTREKILTLVELMNEKIDISSPEFKDLFSTIEQGETDPYGATELFYLLGKLIGLDVKIAFDFLSFSFAALVKTEGRIYIVEPSNGKWTIIPTRLQEYNLFYVEIPEDKIKYVRKFLTWELLLKEPKSLQGLCINMENLTREYPEAPYFQFTKAYLKFITDEPIEAIEILERLNSIYPGFFPARVLLGHCLLYTNQLHEGLAVLTDVIEDMENLHVLLPYYDVITEYLAKAYYLRAETYYELGNYEGARNDLDLALEHDPGLPFALRLRALIAWEIDEDPIEALTYAFRLMDADPTLLNELPPELIRLLLSKLN